jgi:hypothetical protein
MSFALQTCQVFMFSMVWLIRLGSYIDSLCVIRFAWVKFIKSHWLHGLYDRRILDL